MKDLAHPFERALLDIDRRQAAMGQSKLEDTDLTWYTRANETCLRVWGSVEPDGPPSLELIAAAGAHLVAMYRAAERAQMTRVETGAPA